MPFPAITGHGTFTSTGGTSATFSLTAATGEVVLVPVCAEKPASAGFTLSINGGGVTWHQRGSPITVQVTPGPGNTVFATTNLFYGSIVSGVTAQPITITATGTIDDLAGGYVRTATPVGPYDTNLSLPGTTIAPSNSPVGVTISTTDLDDLVYVVGGSPSLGLGTGFTTSAGSVALLFLVQNSGGAGACSCVFSYGTYVAAQSNLTITSEAGQTNVAFIVDALAGALPLNSGAFFAAD